MATGPARVCKHALQPEAADWGTGNTDPLNA